MLAARSWGLLCAVLVGACATPQPVEKPAAVAVAARPAAHPSAAPAKTSAKVASSVPKSAPAVKEVAAPLDLKSLETRLKDTNAIGFFTKVGLKNQVDDLLGQFRAFHQGKANPTLAELRRPYDLLMLKVLALLQDADAELAHAIVASREAIWGILSDQTKFASFDA